MDNRTKEGEKLLEETLIEVHNLVEESASALVIEEEVWDEVRRWIPDEDTVLARLVESEYEKCDTISYAVLTENRLYVANVLVENIVCEEYRVVNIKCFKASDMTAYAFFTQPDSCLELRMMMRDGKRIRLGLSIGMIFAEGNYKLLSRLAKSRFFQQG